VEKKKTNPGNSELTKANKVLLKHVKAIDVIAVSRNVMKRKGRR
jgi:hypothetical protein